MGLQHDVKVSSHLPMARYFTCRIIAVWAFLPHLVWQSIAVELLKVMININIQDKLYYSFLSILMQG
jgi:hypothetical protein